MLANGLLAICLAASPAFDPPADAELAVAVSRVSPEARQAFDNLLTARERGDRTAVDKLAAFGDEAVALCANRASLSDDRHEQRLLHEFLRRHFPNHPRTIELVVNHGLESDDGSLRYSSLWHVGDALVGSTRERLREILRDEDELLLYRLTAAKSLAQLGDPSGLCLLLEGVENPYYMPRYVANTGLKILSGKSLNDFAGYKHGENAHVIGGHEVMFLNEDPGSKARMKAGRYAALAAYLEWLRAERSELYDILVTNF